MKLSRFIRKVGYLLGIIEPPPQPPVVRVVDIGQIERTGNHFSLSGRVTKLIGGRSSDSMTIESVLYSQSIASILRHQGSISGDRLREAFPDIVKGFIRGSTIKYMAINEYHDFEPVELRVEAWKGSYLTSDNSVYNGLSECGFTHFYGIVDEFRSRGEYSFTIYGVKIPDEETRFIPAPPTSRSLGR